MIRGFWLQLVLTAASVAILIALIVAIADGSGTTLGKAILGAISAAGLTTASLTSRLKNATSSLLQRLRQDAYTELIAAAITIVPPVPTRARTSAGASRAANRVITDHGAGRRITMGTT